MGNETRERAEKAEANLTRLSAAVEKHGRTIWGNICGIGDNEDAELYKVWDEIKRSSP